MKRKWVFLTITILAIIVAIGLLYSGQRLIINDQFSIRNNLDNFSPSIITTTTATVLFRDTLTQQITSTTRIITEITQPTEIKDVSSDIKAIVLAPISETTTKCVERLVDIVGDDIHVIDITQIQEIKPNVWASYGAAAVYKIESVIRLAANVEITTPVVLFLDNNDVLLAVFSWPYPDPSKEELMSLANIGLGYYGIYVPLPKSRGIQVLTDDQKRMIADALEPIYKINIYVR